MLNVLVVDDEPNITEGLRFFIKWEAYGCQPPDTAGDTESALALMREKCYAIVITDIRMPGRSGLEFSGVIRREYPETFVIIMSGYQDFEYARSAMQRGVIRYLLKPLNEEELTDAVSAIVRTIQAKKQQDQQILTIVNKSLLQNLSFSYCREGVEFILRKNLSSGCQLFQTYFICTEERLTAALYSKFSTRFNMAGCICFIHSPGAVGMVAEAGDDGKTCPNLDLVRETAASVTGQYTLIVGNMADSVDALMDCLNLAAGIIGSSQQLSGNLMYLAGCKPADETDTGTYIPEYHGLLDAILNCDEEKADREIDLIADDLARLRISKSACISLSTAIVLQMLSTLEGIGSIGDALGEDFDLPDFCHICDIGILRERLRDLSRMVIRYLSALKQRRTYNYLDNIKQYIQDNYDKPLTAKSLASQFYINPLYLGRKFREYAAMSVKDYINNIRIEKAKEMLREGNKKVATIYRDVGYVDLDTFYTQFKKLVGIRPAEYKQFFHRE